MSAIRWCLHNACESAKAAPDEIHQNCGLLEFRFTAFLAIVATVSFVLAFELRRILSYACTGQTMKEGWSPLQVPLTR